MSILDKNQTVHLKHEKIKWLVSSRENAEKLRPLLEKPDSYFNQTAQKATPISAQSTFSESMNRSLWVRRNNYIHRMTKFRDSLRPASPMRAYRASLFLNQIGIPTPRVLAVGVHRKFHVPVKAYLVVDEIHSSSTLAQVALAQSCIPKNLIKNLSGLIAKMHESGYMHGDLTINNILIDKNFQPWFIDLDRAKISRKSLSWKQTILEFHRLARHIWKFSDSIIFSSLRFVMYYCAYRNWQGKEREFLRNLGEFLDPIIKNDRKNSACATQKKNS